MSIFNTILEKLGLQKPAAPAPAPVQPTAAALGRAPAAPVQAVVAHVTNPAPGPQAPARTMSDTPMPAPHPTAISVVDVVSKLDNLAGENSGLDWKVSIVDLLKLLKMDSSIAARKELATELGCPADLMGGDYAKMNVWLHKTVLQKIAENGGNIPQNLLD